MSLSRKVFFNTGSQFAGKIINTIIGLFSVAIITRYLGVAGYGNYTTAFAYIMFFSVISDFGFYWVIVQRISSGEPIKEIVQNAQSLRLIFAGAILAAALILVTFLPYPPQLKIAIIMVAVSIFWMGQNGVYLALFQSQLRMEMTVLAESLGRIVSLASVILAVYLKLDFLWIVAAGLSATLLNYIFNLIFSLKFSPFGFQFNKKIMLGIFMEALPIAVATILGLIYFKIDIVILSIMKPSTDVGIYGTAYKVLEILTALPVMFVGSVFPALSEAFSKKDTERLSRLLRKSFDIISIGSLGIAAFFFGFAKPTIGLIAGESYLTTHTVTFAHHTIGADIVLQILILAVCLNFWNNLFTNSLITFKKQTELIKPYVIATIFNVGANLLLIPKYSYLAAACTTVVTELIVLVFMTHLMRKYAHPHFKLTVFFKACFAAGVMLIIAFFFQEVNYFLMLVVEGLVYLGILYLLKAFDKETILAIVGK